MIENEEKEKVIELDREILENFVRAFLKENDISHLDGLIMAMQAINSLVTCLRREFGMEKLISVLDAADENQSDTMRFVAYMNIKIAEDIENLREKQNGI